MSCSICILEAPRGSGAKQWSYVLSNFTVDQVFLTEPGWDHDGPLKSAMLLPCLSELKLPLVVLAPRHGRYVRGEIALEEFQHPEDAVYLFGSNHRFLTADLLEGLEHELVYVPTDSRDDMFSWVCAAVVLYDRRIKRGKHG